jgi:D-3-phosphoglycerate dehydrogenase / 2-oxoglutarate reductase
MRTLVIGDHFVGSDVFLDAIGKTLGKDFGPVRTVDWAGDSMEAQHAEQQVMEWKGPEAVRTPTEIIDAVGDAQIIAVHFAPIPTAVLDAAKDLKAVVVARTGVENVNLEEATRRGVAVVNVYGRNANAVAEQAVGLMLTEVRDLGRADAAIKAGGWPEEPTSAVFELAERTIGLIGFGNVGRKLARRLSGFDVELLVYDPYVDATTISQHGGHKVEDFDRIFREADVVSLHARLTEETHRFIGREQFEQMKPSAYFINNARSRMVDYDALYDALASRRIAGAALDVHEDEPLPADSPWRRLPNITLVPHTAGVTPEVWTNSGRLVAEAIKELVDTGQVTNTVNPEATEGRS